VDSSYGWVWFACDTHLIDTEVLHAPRRMTIRGELGGDRASEARRDFSDMQIARYPHAPLSERVWRLRHNLSAYEATFVALAEVLGVPLLTCDACLSASPGLEASVELFSPAG
jgi:predicted nucleic acid-binding protein